MPKPAAPIWRDLVDVLFGDSDPAALRVASQHVAALRRRAAAAKGKRAPRKPSAHAQGVRAAVARVKSDPLHAGDSAADRNDAVRRQLDPAIVASTHPSTLNRWIAAAWAAV